MPGRTAAARAEQRAERFSLVGAQSLSDAATLLSASRAIRAETVVLAAKIAVESDDLPRLHSILRAGVSEARPLVTLQTLRLPQDSLGW